MSWSYSVAIVVAAVQIFYVAVTSRFLPPRAFGLYAIALLAMNVGDTFAGLGVAQAIVQKPTVDRNDIRAAFTSGIGMGVLFFAALWFLAPAIAVFFTEPDSVPVIRLMGLHFILLGFGLTSQALLRRQHRFRALALAQLVSMTVGYGIVGPVMAVAGMGVWSLAVAVLTAHLLNAAINYGTARHPLRPIFAVENFRSLYGFGTRVSALTLLDFAGRQLDVFAVGRYSTTALLGQYSRGFVLVNLPLGQHLRQAITRVMFPGFSRIQTDLERLTRAYASAIMLGGALLFSVAAGMAVARREIVLVLLGDQWDVAATLVPFFAVAVAVSVMTKFAELLCQARAELNQLLVLQGAYIVLLAAGYVAVSGAGGVLPFAATLAVGELVRHGAVSGLLRRKFGIPLRAIWLAYAPAVVSAAIVGSAVFVGRQVALLAGLPVAAVLAVEMVCGALGLVLSTRFNPFSRLRRELYQRLSAAGVFGSRRRPVARFALLLTGDQPPRQRLPVG